MYPNAYLHGSVEHLLVVANETLARASLTEAVAELSAPGASVFVLCPTRVSRARLWTSDLSAGMVAAGHRLEATLSTLRDLGLDADGMVGDTDPLLAIEDALCMFPAEHLLLCVHPALESSSRDRRMIERAHQRFQLPQSRVVVGLAEDARIAASGRSPRVPTPA